MRKPKLQDFGPYRIVSQVAVGGMAEIYLGRQRGLEGVERTVILKRILERYADDDEFITMFLDEARLLAALSHPNIAAVFDVGKVENTYYLAMEHVRGPTLGRLLAAARERDGAELPRPRALGIALSVAEALHYAHERRDDLGRPLDIVHRDLNPANVMVSYDGAVKLIDFGIAKAATKVYETRTGVIKGTYGYIAPEQLLGEPRVDRRADVFALGILLYEMCVGAHPYDVSGEPNPVDCILEARYVRPRQVRPDFPEDLDLLIARCLAPKPEDRPESMGSLIDALVTHMAAQGIVPTQTGLAEVVRTLVPDEEGPRPLKPLTRVSRKAPLIQEPDSTRRLRLGGATTPAAGRTLTQPVETDKGPEWDGPTVLYGANEAESDEQRATDRLPGVPPPDVVPTAHAATAKLAAIDEEPTSVAARDGHEAPSMAGTAWADDTAVERKPESPTETTTRRIGRPLIELLERGRADRRTILAFAAALTGLVAVSVGVWQLAAGGGKAAEKEVVRRTEGAANEPGETDESVTLRVLSEPPGAAVYVDGRRAEDRTPVSVQLPTDRSKVWLRLSKEGYLEQEREVSARAGEARFVLTRVQLDAGSAEDRTHRRRRGGGPRR